MRREFPATGTRFLKPRSGHGITGALFHHKNFAAPTARLTYPRLIFNLCLERFAVMLPPI